MVFQWYCHRNSLTISTHNKLWIQAYGDFNVIQGLLPFLVHFIFENKLNVWRIRLHCIDEEQRNFLRGESLLSHNVINDRLRFVIISCRKLIYGWANFPYFEWVGGNSLVQNLGIHPILVGIQEVYNCCLCLVPLYDYLAKLYDLLDLPLKQMQF